MSLFSFEEIMQSRMHWKVPHNCFRNYEGGGSYCSGVDCECYEDLFLRKDKNMNDLNVKINDDISEDLLNMKLTDMFCKHVIRRNSDGIQIKAGKLYIESCKLGYKVCNWGLHVGHASDIQYHINSIVQMERDGYNPAIRIVVCKYDFCDTHIVWVDNLHSAIKYIREYGKDIKLRDIPFYVVDISDYEHPSVYGHNGSLRKNYEDILGAVSCAYKRFRRSNSKELIEIGYTLRDFLCDNPMLYTELNTHLGLINTFDDVDTIFDKSVAFNSLYNSEEYLYGER